MTDMVNHPPHYANIPDGLEAECIEYARHMPYAQGAAFKYIYRAGSKGDPAQDLAKAAWYVQEARDHGNFTNVTSKPGFPRIDPNTTHRAKALHYLAHGRLDVVAKALEQFGTRITEKRGDQ